MNAYIRHTHKADTTETANRSAHGTPATARDPPATARDPQKRRQGPSCWPLSTPLSAIILLAV